MNGRFASLLSGIAGSIKKSKPITVHYGTSKPITVYYSTSIATSVTTQLATDFQQLTDRQLNNVIQTYNHALPTFYKNNVMNLVPDKALRKLFYPQTYLDR